MQERKDKVAKIPIFKAITTNLNTLSIRNTRNQQLITRQLITGQNRNGSNVIVGVQNRNQQQKSSLKQNQLKTQPKQRIQKEEGRHQQEKQQQQNFMQNHSIQQQINSQISQLRPMSEQTQPQMQQEQQSQQLQPQMQSQQPKYQLSDTMKENVLQDFVSIRIDYYLKHLEFSLKDTMPQFFFTLTYAAACESPKEYESILSQYLDETNSNDKFIASTARKINMILRCTDFETLKTLEPYNYLEKIQPPKNAEEAHESVQQIQAILRPQYLRLVAKVDVHSPQYNFKESLLQDFVALRFTYDIGQLEYCLKHTMPNLFFMLIYSAVSVSPKEYESIISQYLDEIDSTDKFIASTARKINSTLYCQDFETLKTLEPYNYLLKIQPMDNNDEALKMMKQSQDFIRPKYLKLVEQIDVDGKYTELVKYGWIKDFKQLC